MNDKTTILAFLKVVVLFLLLISCAPINQSSTPTWLTSWTKNPACTPPCWENIVPGVTTQQEARTALSNLQGIKDIEDTDVIPYGKGLQWDNRASLFFDDNNVVKQINIQTVHSEVVLDNLLADYGPPKYVVIYWQETVGVDVDLVYPEIGFVINLYSQDAEIITQDNVKITLTPEQEVYGISFYVPNLEYYYSTAWEPLKRYEWKGFTTYP